MGEGHKRCHLVIASQRVARMRNVSMSSPRKRGPITTDACCGQNCGPSFAQHRHSWLWVPARASLGRDDGESDSIFKQPDNFRCDSAISRRDAPEVLQGPFRLSDNRGRRECRMTNAPAASCVKKTNTRVSHHGHTGTTRHSPRNGFTAYFALSPATRLYCHRRLRFFTQT